MVESACRRHMLAPPRVHTIIDRIPSSSTMPPTWQLAQPELSLIPGPSPSPSLLLNVCPARAGVVHVTSELDIGP